MVAPSLAQCSGGFTGRGLPSHRHVRNLVAPIAVTGHAAHGAGLHRVDGSRRDVIAAVFKGVDNRMKRVTSCGAV